MLSRLGVLSSDSINRDGYVIAFQALEQMIAQSAVNGLPQLIDHDFHRPLGWMVPFGVLIEPKLSRAVGNFYYAQTDQELKQIIPAVNNHWQRTNTEACQPHIADFKAHLKADFSDEGRFIGKGAVAYHLKDITSKVFPNLFSNLDKSGLTYLDDILKEFDYAGCGIFKSKTTAFCIFCHQYFKRSLSLLNNYNTHFIDEFIRLNYRPELTLRIAIDSNLIGLSSTIRGNLEFDYWWGPKFSDDIATLPNGVTRYESSEEQKLFSSVLGTEFWWKTDENEKTLEIEEIREKPTLGIGNESYGCRYIHSIYNSATSDFIHFDGAIRMYDEEQIFERWENKINTAGKNIDYTKLFRVDGKLALADWKKLCILYYKGNPLLFEYFGAKEEYEELKNKSKPLNTSKEEELIPYKVDAGDGIRLFASYFKKRDDYQSFEWMVVHPDTIQFRNGKTMQVLEYDIIEIKKFIRRKGGTLKFPDETKFIMPLDFYTNYSMILHGSSNTGKLLEITLDAFRSILEIQNKRLNKTVSLAIAWEMEEFECRLSIFGKSGEVFKWLNQIQQIPTEHASFKDWLKIQREWICENYSYQQHDLLHLVQSDGMFLINRKLIDPSMINFPDENNQDFMEISAEEDDELGSLIKGEKIFPAQLCLLEKISCTKTGEDYFLSATSEYFDEGVKMAVEKMDLLGLFWTDEPFF